VWLVADVHRVDCRACGRVRTEEVPWARAGARHSRDFEDLLAWLAQRMDKSSIARLLRCSWEAVDAIVRRVVADRIDDKRLDGLVHIGVDEISYKRGHRYLTVVANHDTGTVVWVGEDRNKESFEKFFDALGEQRAAAVEAITSDASTSYLPVARARAPQATICLDPFHVIKWAGEALDLVWEAHKPSFATKVGYKPSRRPLRRARYALRIGAEKLKPEQHAFVAGLRRDRYRLFRAWELKEQLRGLYRGVTVEDAAGYLKAWITRALRSRINAFINLARKLRRHFDIIIASIHHGLSNARLEGINAKIRVIQRRGYGHPNAQSLANMIYLCLGGITITPPTQR
jgi:transposase